MYTSTPSKKSFQLGKLYASQVSATRKTILKNGSDSKIAKSLFCTSLTFSLAGKE
jgi:hypothetical protein